MNYYNEFHPPAAAILRGLVADKLIPEGHVDDRSITEIRPSDLDGYTQCHFFAGIGGWSYALELAGWPTDRPVWTGSCPCQPFSSAGKQKGKEDERHLWPVWLGLIRQCCPATVFGEQVASAIAHGWLDDVYQGMEAEGYAVGAAVLPACSVGAPHKRDRLWFVADATGERSCGAIGASCEAARRSTTGNGLQLGRTGDECPIVANTEIPEREQSGSSRAGREGASRPNCPLAHPESEQTQRPGQTGFQPVFTQSSWSNSQWIDCPDGKQRLVEPSIPLLADGFPERVACLHGFGNAIVPQVAAEFIKAYK